MQGPLVSVIVPTKNSARTIEKSLMSIKKQTYENIELIVVDNFSTDETYKIAKKYTDKIYQKGPERTAQKNFGIDKANGKYLLLIDGDMLIDRELVEDCVNIMENYGEKGGGVCIPVVDIGTSWWVKVIAFERSFYKDTSIEAARFLRKDLVKKVGGYKDIIFYEEFIVPQEIAKLGYNVKLHTTYNIYHDYGDFTFLGNLKKKFYYGKSLDEYKKKVREIGVEEILKEQISIFRRYIIFFKNKRFYKTPLLAIGVLVLKFLEFMAGGIGVLFGKVEYYLNKKPK